MNSLCLWTGMKIWRKKKEKTRIQEKITSLCVQTGVQILKNKIGKIRKKYQKDNEGKTPQNSPTFLSATIFTLQPPESSIKQLTKESTKTPTEEENKCNILAMLLGPESSKTLEDTD